MSATELAMTGRLFIDGAWAPASSGGTFPVEDPGTGRHLADVADATVADGLAAVAAADAAAGAWAATPPRDRAEVLRRAFDLMKAHREELGALVTRENGKALTEAIAEIDYAAEFLRWFSEEACRALGEVSTSPAGAYRILVTRNPVGPCIFVTPWNFPAAMATRKIGPALAAGCTTILKPARETPLTALAMAAIFEQAGVPAGVVNVVPTTNSGPVTEAIMTDPRMRKVSFTGSTAVGKTLLEIASRRVLRASMELGGNAPFLVLADADIEEAVAAAMIAKLRNGGQSCTAANRFYVHTSVAQEFGAAFAAAMRGQFVGYGLDEGVTIGAMIHARARDAVLELIADATDRGATLATGGHAVGTSGYFLEPTLLTGVPHDARVMTEEIFGPVAPIATFETIEEAIALANGTPYGLMSYVMSRDLRAALSVAERLESGMVAINRGVISDPAAPFGGRKESGLGREGSHEGLMEFLETKYIGATW